MADRAEEIAAALAAWGFGGWRRAPLAGDASARRYVRLTGPGGASRILMDAPPGACPPVDRFLAVAAHLHGAGLRAPAIDAADPARGLIVMEDFGDDLMARRADRAPDEAPGLYAAAAEVLCRLQAVPPMPGLAALDPEAGAAAVAEVLPWALPEDGGATEAAVRDALRDALGRLAPEAGAMALRDYHAENLVVLPGGGGLGLLDFQDAVRAHPVYDLVSLVRDVRREVSPAARDAAVAAFAAGTGTAPDRLAAAMAAVAAQRNLRILGVFRRLAARDGKPRYLDFLPRLRRLLAEDLAHPDLAALRRAAAPLLDPATMEAGR